MKKVKLVREVIVYSLILICSILFFEQTVLGCSCPMGFYPPCVAFQRAEFVFIGKTGEMLPDEPADNEDIGGINGYIFSKMTVSKSFKGNLPKQVNVKFPKSGCSYKPKKDEILFVYGYKSRYDDSLFVRMCDRTGLLSNHRADLKNAKLNISNKFATSINGGVLGLSNNDLQKVIVNISGNNLNANLKVDMFGFFSLPINQRGKFQVKMTVPIESNFYMLGIPNFELQKSNGQTNLIYDVELSNKNCDCRTAVTDGFF